MRSELAERWRRLRAPGATAATSLRPGGGVAPSLSSRGAPVTLPAPPEAAPSTATRPAAVRRAQTRRAVAEKRRRRSRTGGCFRGCGGGADDPRTTSAAMGASGRPGEDVAGFGGRAGATAARGERLVGSRGCWLGPIVMRAALH